MAPEVRDLGPDTACDIENLLVGLGGMPAPEPISQAPESSAVGISLQSAAAWHAMAEHQIISEGHSRLHRPEFVRRRLHFCPCAVQPDRQAATQCAHLQNRKNLRASCNAVLASAQK